MGSVKNGPSEGGSGGKRGHSSMDHWGYTDEVKESARRIRRSDDRSESRTQMDEWFGGDDEPPGTPRRDASFDAEGRG